MIHGQAAADDGNDAYPTGEIHSMLVFVAAATAKEAQRTARREIEAAGWAEPRLHRMGEIEATSVEGRDATLRAAYESAVQEGAALVVYDQADDGYAE